MKRKRNDWYSPDLLYSFYSSYVPGSLTLRSDYKLKSGKWTVC